MAKVTMIEIEKEHLKIGKCPDCDCQLELVQLDDDYALWCDVCAEGYFPLEEPYNLTLEDLTGYI